MADPSFTNLRVGQARRLYIDKAKESVFGTANQSPPVTHLLNHACDFPPLVRKPIIINDAAFASGNQSMSPRKNIVVGYTLDTDIPIWAEHHAMAILCSALAGNDSVGSQVALTGFFPHTVTLRDVPYFLPGHSIQENRNTKTIVSGDGGIVALGCAVTEVSISWQQSGFVIIRAKILGSGKTSDSASITETGDLLGQGQFLTYDKVRVTYLTSAVLGTSLWDGTFSTETDLTAGAFASVEGIGGTPFVDITRLIEKGTIRLQTGASDLRAGGLSGASAVYGGNPIALNPQAFLDLTWRTDDTTKTWLRGFADQTTLAQLEIAFCIEFAGTVDEEYTKIVLPLCAMMDNPGGGTGFGMTVHDSTFEARKPTAGSVQPVHMWFQIHESTLLNS
jgi:hypothetical protein